MKFFFAILVVAITVAAFDDEDWVAGFIPRTHRAVIETDNNSTAYCQSAPDYSTICETSPGCNNTAPFMCYKGAPIKQDPCAPPTPYCSDGTCVATAPSGCSSDSFKCPRPGYFPQFNDCFTYYYCSFDGTVFTAQKRQCPPGYPFNPTGPQDRLCLKGGYCVTIACTAGKSAEWRPMNYVNFTQDQIAAYCIDGKFNKIDSCNPGLSIDLSNTASKSCSLKCVTDYQKAVASNSTSGYYLCLGGKPYYQECETGQIFDGTSLNCITAPPSTTPPA